MSEWISVDEQPPLIGQFIFICSIVDRVVRFGKLTRYDPCGPDGEKWFSWTFYPECNVYYTPTHWMKVFPEAPSKGIEGDEQ